MKANAALSPDAAVKIKAALTAMYEARKAGDSFYGALLDAEQALRNVQRQSPAALDSAAKGLAAAWRALPGPLVAALEQLDLAVIAMGEAPSHPKDDAEEAR